MSVDLQRMAEAFNTDVVSLEDELTGLILEGQISARIDSHAKVCWQSVFNTVHYVEYDPMETCYPYITV